MSQDADAEAPPADAPAAAPTRDTDRQQLPGRMRRDVRLLGDMLGEVLRESGGQDLLDDVERLRQAVIAARASHGAAGISSPGGSSDGAADSGQDPAGDQIAALVASWPLDRAELVARAFTVYFHLTNLAEELQRVRALREQDTGQAPVRESLAASVAEFRREQGPGHLGDLLARLRVHPVLTAHPTEARRRAVATALRRISDLVTALDDDRRGAAEQAETRRRLREEIDLLWRTSQLRANAMTPIDEVRTVMAAFDETIFQVVPRVYRALDEARREAGAGPGAPAVPAFLRYGSWVGADRDGNPFVTAQVTRETAVIQADHVLRALENATTRIGRALTVQRGGGAAVRRVRGGPGGGRDGPPGAARRSGRPLAARAVPDLSALPGPPARGDPAAARGPGLPRRRGLPRRPAPGAGLAGRRGRHPAGVR